VHWKPQQAMLDRYFSQSEALVVAETISNLPELLSRPNEL
jgi:hypothetical protein